MEKYSICYGEMNCGFSFFGLFETREEAVKWAEENPGINSDIWSVIPIYSLNSDCIKFTE